MKISNFKIRDRLLHKNKLDPLQAETQDFQRKDHEHETHLPNLDPKFQIFMEKFQSFMNFQMNKNSQNIQRQTVKPIKYTFESDYRDRFILIDLPQFKSNRIQCHELEVWTGQLCRQVLSASFNYYSTGKFTYEQSKVYASESILRNISRLAERYDIKADELMFIDKKMKTEILPYLKAKYPMTNEKDSNKSLQKAIKQINNIQVLTNDFFYHTDIEFIYRENGRYDDLIMMLINQIMSKVNQKPFNASESSQLTNFKDFEVTLADIFQKCYDESWMNSKVIQEKIIKNITEKILQTATNKELDQKKIKRKESLLLLAQEDPKNQLQADEAKKQKYKLQVQQYTNFQIGRKISENTELFSQDQIKSQILTIKSAAILRILTKWCDQLWEKFNNQNYFIERTEGMRMEKGKQINIVYPWLKVQLKTQIKKQKQNILKFMKEIEQANYFQQMLLLKSQLQGASAPHIDKIENVTGKFSCKVVNNLENYIVIYLNRLIHGLKSVSTICYKQMSGMPSWSSPPNLISFKIGDLMRCKFSSKQREVLRVFEEIQRINDQQPEKMKIIRIKNRLNLGTNDLLINVKFNNKIICEIQLGISSAKTQFIKCSYNFNHYIYEIQRSIFGPISELCNIWKNLQNRSKQFSKMIQRQTPIKQTQLIQKSTCYKLQQSHTLVENDRPFVCCQCSTAYYRNNYMISHVKCSKCTYWKCAICLITQNKAAKNKDFFLTNETLNVNASFLQSQNIPLQGICIFLKKKPLQPIVFKCLQYNQKKYLFKKNDQLNRAEFLRQIGTSKQTKQFINQCVLFSLPQIIGRKYIDIQITLAKTQFIIPSYISKCFKLQKETISILKEQLSQINLDVMQTATKQQKKCIKYIEFSSTNLNNMDLVSKDFVNLDCLNMNINQIQDISKVLQFSKLQNLYMISNKITIIPSEIHILTKLKQINLYNNQIKELPQKIFLLKQLTSLKINNNELESLPQNLPQNLKVLIANLNCIKQFPHSLSKHKQIEIINLNLNDMTTMPQQIQELGNLRQLNLSCNKLKVLPIKMKKMKKLQKALFNNNEFQQVDKSISDWSSLIQIDLSANQIKDLIFEPQMEMLQKLVIFVLSDNKIQSINDSFKHLKHVQSVKLVRNQIKDLSQQCLFIEELRQIDFSQNKQ